MTEIIKVCKRHGELKREDVIKQGKNKINEARFKCKSCMKEIHHANYEKNKDKIYVRTRKWKKDNAERLNELRLKYYWQYKEKDHEKKIERDRKYHNKSSMELNDVYVKHVITKRTNLKYSDIPDELVKLKRSLLEAQRKIRQNLMVNKGKKLNENKKC